MGGLTVLSRAGRALAQGGAAVSELASPGFEMSDWRCGTSFREKTQQGSPSSCPFVCPSASLQMCGLGTPRRVLAAVAGLTYQPNTEPASRCTALGRSGRPLRRSRSLQPAAVNPDDGDHEHGWDFSGGSGGHQIGCSGHRPSDLNDRQREHSARLRHSGLRAGILRTRWRPACTAIARPLPLALTVRSTKLSTCFGLWFSVLTI